jgi:hypothetical protein
VKGVEAYTNPTISSGKPQFPVAGGVKAALPQCPPMPADEDLQAVVKAWATLPVALRAGILAMVKAAER